MKRVASVAVVGSLTSALLVGTAGPAAAAERGFLWNLPSVTFMVTKASCWTYYLRDCRTCRMIPFPQARAVCWAAASAKLGACYARASD